LKSYLEVNKKFQILNQYLKIRMKLSSHQNKKF